MMWFFNIWLVYQNILTALDQTWHPDHFFCTHCGAQFGPDGKSLDGSFFFPGNHNHTTMSWKQPCVLSLGINLTCFMHVAGFLEKDGKPYCCKDFYQLFAPKCSGCGESVRENYLTAANGTWHPECFVCAVSFVPRTTHARFWLAHEPGNKWERYPHICFICNISTAKPMGTVCLMNTLRLKWCK